VTKAPTIRNLRGARLCCGLALLYVCVWRHISLIQVKAEHTAPRAFDCFVACLLSAVHWATPSLSANLRYRACILDFNPPWSARGNRCTPTWQISWRTCSRKNTNLLENVLTQKCLHQNCSKHIKRVHVNEYEIKFIFRLPYICIYNEHKTLKLEIIKFT